MPRSTRAAAQAGAPSQRSRITALVPLLLPLVLLLTACPPFPPAEKIDFATDPRILRGPYEGLVYVYGPPATTGSSAGEAAVSLTGEGAPLPITLEAAPRYVSPQGYVVSGTLSLAGAPPLAFTGSVRGYHTQEYLQPVMSPPREAEFVLQLEGHPWELHGFEPAPYLSDADRTSWSGRVIDASAPEAALVGWFELWRAASPRP